MIPFEEYKDHNIIYGARKLRGDKYECAQIFTLDIETTSYFVAPDGRVHGFDADKSDDYYKECEKGAFCYIWQFSIDDIVFYGRHLKDLKSFLRQIANDVRRQTSLDPMLFCYIHNAAFEFQFLREYLDITDAFCREKRKPIKFHAEEFEFRCSYMLTRLSLKSWGKKLGLPKLSGTVFDYNKLRTPYTELNEYEMQYAERDCLVVYEGIKTYVRKYKSIKNIPLTQTGEVRKKVKSLYSKDSRHFHRMTALLPDEKEYTLLRAAFQGGSTGAYAYNARDIVYCVDSYDEASAYPYAMFVFMYPQERFKPYKKQVDIKDFDKYAYLLVLRISDLKARTHLAYWSRYHTISITGGKYNNGKVMEANEMYIVCTEQDLLTLMDVYTFKYEVVEAYRAYKNYLNDTYRKYIAELFRDKTTLDGVEGREDDYLISKQFINSLYGMSVTDLLQTTIEYDENNPDVYTAKEPVFSEEIEKKKKRFYTNFTSYAYGVWVTAYCRRRLYKALMACGDDLVYYDTDSCKFLHNDRMHEYFEEENKKVDRILEWHCQTLNIPLEWVKAKKPNGKIKTLGHWEYEGMYEQFVTLGAKKYAFIKDDTIGITVAGVPKEYAKTLHSLEEFKTGHIFDRDAQILDDDGLMMNIGKNAITYIDNLRRDVIINEGMTDEYRATNINAINMKPASYTLDITQDYAAIIERLSQIKKGML